MGSMAGFWDEVLAFAAAVTTTVGDRLLADFEGAMGAQKTEEKADGSLLTRSDQWADQTLVAAIAARFPDHGVLSEEGSHHFPAGDWCWVIDPIDGTTNFARGIPLWGISLGLLYRGWPVFGYLYFPPTHQRFHGFWAGASGALDLPPDGAFCNGRAIAVPPPEEPNGNHTFSVCTRSVSQLPPKFPHKVRMLGVSTYNLLTVAMGATLGALEANPKVWDLSAIWAIAHGAGVTWVPLENYAPFPLVAGQDYGSRPNRCLVVPRVELGDYFHDLLPL